MRYDYSMIYLPSALPGNKGLHATVRRHIEDLRLGALGLPGFHLPTFTNRRSRLTPLSPYPETHLSFWPESNRRPIVLRRLLYPTELLNLQRCVRLSGFDTF